MTALTGVIVTRKRHRALPAMLDLLHTVLEHYTMINWRQPRSHFR